MNGRRPRDALDSMGSWTPLRPAGRPMNDTCDSSVRAASSNASATAARLLGGGHGAATGLGELLEHLAVGLRGS